MSNLIEIDADEPVDALTVRLVGVEYTVTPPKVALALKMHREVLNVEKGGGDPVSSIGTWLESAVGKRDAKKILARLDDPADRLDIPHIMSLIKAIMTYSVEGNPPTS